ncbi:tetratricopeptide repeat protein [Emcibacter sp. SYSU 3D8]|uniref:tetratricopeptide repeat protein n=1 Tax=Emcibacter sp. SYSU 3D8 TaxID=3133969 RepID=UPI0031FE8D22
MNVRLLMTLTVLLCTTAAPAWAGAITILGDSKAAHCSRAALFGRADDTSLSTCDVALTHETLDQFRRASTFINRGIIHMRRRDWDRAHSDFDSALQRKPEMGEGWVNRGALLIGTRRFAEGLADTNKGLELGLDEPEKAYYNRAIAHEGLGDLTSAYYDYQQALALNPEWELPRKELTRFTVTRRPAR